ncbi:MAG: hypothetical protein WBP44_00660 [Gammaproteobacteria bacterium]|jgi:hypothetical protein
MKKKRAIVILVAALSLPLPSSAVATEDMFAVMFRMMLVMMNVMSDAMLGNTNNSDFGSVNPFAVGAGGWPAMSGLYGMNPVSGVSNFSGMSPWSGMGMSPWSNSMNPNSWANPFASDYSPYGSRPFSSAGYGGPPAAMPSVPVSLLEGRWFGQSGEILEIRGDRFRLVHGKYSITGVIRIKNNIVNLFSQQTGTVTQYTFIRNQTELMLQDASGLLLNFSKRPGNGVVRRF